MSRDRTNVIGIVLITTCVTAAVLVAGWFGASQYLAQKQTVSAVPEEAPAAAPAPRRKTPRAPKTDSGRGGPQNQATSTDPASAGAAATAANEGAAARPDSEASSGGGRGSAPPAEGDPGRGQPPTELPSTPIEAITAPAVLDHADARTIMTESQRRSDARFYRYDGLLQSFDPKGTVTDKRWTFDREGSHGQSKAVLRFTAPAEVKGVALLIFNHPERASDQWMWTPALERDRRIALQDRSTRFFGTDFSFEDLEERDVDQFDHSLLGNETLDGAACWKIQTTPKRSRSSQYTHSIAWIRKDNYVLARLDNFVKGEVVKRLTCSTIEDIQGIWTARQLEMADLHRGTRTRLTLQQVKYNAPMKEGDFTLQAIRR
jgi:hypothetical protein